MQEKSLPDNLDALREALAQFFTYKNNDKPEKAAEKLALEALFNSIAMKLKTNNRQPFVPPEGTSPAVCMMLYLYLDRIGFGQVLASIESS
jgi:hypothetical protein